MTRTQVVGRGDRSYPPLLERIHDPPACLYLRGSRTALLQVPAVAIVGARSCSSYGADVARALGRELSRAGVLVISGLARGIDGEAHRGALEGGGLTLAVLGCGIDRDYPRANASLARQIADVGLIVSEYPPGVEPAPWRFPARNRIVAGIARATIVVEARERSGALITADFALEDGREVFAVPGEITSGLSRGTNELIAAGATPVTSVEDLLAALGVRSASVASEGMSATAAGVLQCLRDSPASIDELARGRELRSEEVGAALVELELAGLASGKEGIYRAVPGR